MKITIFEVCRSPEIEKVTELVLLSRFFNQKDIGYDLYSNDHCWPNPVSLSKAFITTCLTRSDPDIVHLAMHGDDFSFVLRWSRDRDFRLRVAEDMLTGPDILKVAEWRGKLIVSGACHSSNLAPFFLAAGARAVVAPTVPINWPNLGQFFCLFYEVLLSGQAIETALTMAVSEFPEYRCYKVHRTS